MDLGVLSSSYAEARDTSLAAAHAVGAELQHRPHPLIGTIAPAQGARLLRGDDWLWQHGHPTGPEAEPRRRALRDHFFPLFDDWQEMVLSRSDQVFRQALKGLAET